LLSARETGRSWVPASGNRISLGTTAAIVDGRSYLQARRERVRDANMVHGTPVICRRAAAFRQRRRRQAVRG
jgi:hypothetical protein